MNSQDRKQKCTDCILPFLIYAEYKSFTALTLLGPASGSFTNTPHGILTLTFKGFISFSKICRGVFDDFSKVSQ